MHTFLPLSKYKKNLFLWLLFSRFPINKVSPYFISAPGAVHCQKSQRKHLCTCNVPKPAEYDIFQTFQTFYSRRIYLLERNMVVGIREIKLLLMQALRYVIVPYKQAGGGERGA